MIFLAFAFVPELWRHSHARPEPSSENLASGGSCFPKHARTDWTPGAGSRAAGCLGGWRLARQCGEFSPPLGTRRFALPSGSTLGFSRIGPRTISLSDG